MTIRKPPDPEWLTPAEVCAALRVDVVTVGRWRKAGKIHRTEFTRTPGGHYRYRASWLRGMLTGGVK